MNRRIQLERIQLALSDMYALLVDLGIDPGEIPFDPASDGGHWERSPLTIGHALGELAIRLEELLAEER